ncbi:hypothetical protein [Thiolapillus sp.]|uniref:hypothetical protein n=1 Tax=Thiolapillus sp. TaxID=2017437 RepID=UPI003AF62EE7
MNKSDIISGGTVALYHGHTLGTLFFTPAGFVQMSVTCHRPLRGSPHVLPPGIISLTDAMLRDHCHVATRQDYEDMRVAVPSNFSD